jgi:hypothetical protein
MSNDPAFMVDFWISPAPSLTARAECPKWGTLGPIEGSIFFPWVKYWGYPKKVN